jgi:hypothetical protein
MNQMGQKVKSSGNAKDKQMIIKGCQIEQLMTQVAMCEDHPGYMKGQKLIYNAAWRKCSQIADEADYQAGITVTLRMMSSI